VCTCFVKRQNDFQNDLIIAMNFDNHGWDFSVSTNSPNLFVVNVDVGYGKYPSFGINSQGIFVNNLFVDSNGKGLYKRKNAKRTLTSYLVDDILQGNISIDNLDHYLDRMEIVNDPNASCHNLIADKNGNVWVIEPGRGNIKNKTTDSNSFVMTNFSLIDYANGKKYTDNGFDRYHIVKNMLDKKDIISLQDAFEILKNVVQNGEWETDFSLVYSKNEHTVYYCYKSDFKKIMEYNLSMDELN
jgi:hypothetical protein